jgi:Flp pilus assembly protein TadG
VNRGNHDRGAAVVEFALVVPILLLLVFGIIEFGRLYSIQSSLTAAARNGARVMALDNNSTAAKAAVTSAAQPYTVAATRIVVTPTSCPTPNTTNASVKVTVSYPVNLLSGWFGTSITLTGTGVMRCNG